MGCRYGLSEKCKALSSYTSTTNKKGRKERRRGERERQKERKKKKKEKEREREREIERKKEGRKEGRGKESNVQQQKYSGNRFKICMMVFIAALHIKINIENYKLNIKKMRNNYIIYDASFLKLCCHLKKCIKWLSHFKCSLVL
jgi:hypothetical protein